MNKIRFFLSACFLILLVQLPFSSALWAQALEPEAEQALEEQRQARDQDQDQDFTYPNDDFNKKKEPLDERAFRPGSFDLLLGVGLDFGGLFYPHIEPGIDIGLIPIDDYVTISLGASVDVGYCVFCSLLNFATSITGTPFKVESYYVAPTVRAMAHFNILSTELKIPELDISAGLLVSPSFYAFRLTYGDGRATEMSTIVSAGPTFNARYMLSDSFLVFLEYRYLISFGASEITVKNSANETYTFHTGDGGRYGQSYVLGVGFRI